MANILDWNEVSRTEFTSCYKEKNIAQFKKIVALGYLIQQKYRNDIRNMLP